MRQLKIANRITSRESLALEKYLQDISKIEMMTSDEEAAWLPVQEPETRKH